MSLPINHLGGGKKLPALSNPATAAQIQVGYQAINGAGELMTGEMEPGLSVVTGSFTSARSGSTVSVGVGAKPKYVILSGSNTSGANIAGFAYLTSGGTVGGKINNYDGVNYTKDASFSSKSYVTISASGFAFKTPNSTLASVSITYYAFV